MWGYLEWQHMCKPAHSSTLLDMKDIGAVYCTKHWMKFLLGKLASCLLVFYIRFRITWITITWITTVTMEVSTAAAAWKRTGWWYTPWKFFWSKPVATRRWPWCLRQHTIFIFWCKTILEANLAYMQSQWMLKFHNFLGGMHWTPLKKAAAYSPPAFCYTSALPNHKSWLRHCIQHVKYRLKCN